ncbi:hypothetical protein SELMODRAFT_429659 [Selaginella moellendorffii]|uniref:Uncharacterized protein n=1 Tax=Selaginella moellendorffii TaxID=88036 RepID=D8T6W5_SELML|nr:hypothetical protein SELMODRAFT_429659 [Selaginella moellendorffii]
MSNLWKCITRARGIDEVRSSIPNDYFGNVISHTHSTAKDLLEKPASHATDLIQASIKRLDNGYIRSQMDFVELQQKNPVQITRSGKTVLSPNLSVTSWAQLPIYELDFGYGTPVFAGGPYVPFEGISIMLPSYTRDGSIDVACLSQTWPSSRTFASMYIASP